MDRLTSQKVERLRVTLKLLTDYDSSVNEDEVDALCDLALQSLSQEAVRDEVLGEFSIHYDFDLERITLAMVEAVDDEYAHNEKLRIAYAHDAEYRRRTIAAIHQRLLKGWIDLVIKPLLTKYHRHFQSMQRIVERETLKREPNAAAQASGSSEHTVASANPAPAAPDVANEATLTAEWLEAFAEGLIHPESPFTQREISQLRKAAAILARLGQGWIPVSERLPEGDGQVLVTYNTGGADVLTRQAVRNLYEAAEIEGDDECFITHWMPLPPAPGASSTTTIKNRYDQDPDGVPGASDD